MSKLGKKPIPIPKDTKVKLESGKLIFTGPKGSRELSINDKIFTATIADEKNLVLKLIKKNENNSILWGTTRSIINSAILGVTMGHEKILELSGDSRETLKWTLLDQQMASSAEDYLSFPLTEESYQNLIETYSS